MAPTFTTPGKHPSPSASSWWNLAAAAFLGMLLLGLALLAWRVSTREVVEIGTEADRIYLVDGFHEPERSPEFGVYRWTEPLAQITLPGWGSGRINVGIGTPP